MSFWRYRAYDGNLAICDGVLVGPDAEDAEEAILLHLRHQGLQGVILHNITRVEYAQEMRLQKFKERINPPKVKSIKAAKPKNHPPKTRPSLVARIFSFFSRDRV